MNDYSLAIATYLQIPPEDVGLVGERIHDTDFSVYWRGNDMLLPYENSFEPEYCYRQKLIDEFAESNPPGPYDGYIDWIQLGHDLMSDVSYDLMSVSKEEVMWWLDRCFEKFEYSEEEQQELLDIAESFDRIYIHIFGDVR